jgi:pimeloyl-ACP methyl ester carboxylesterase
MSISHWADDRAATGYRAAYARSLELWPTAMRRRSIETPFGRTHVIESGCPSGEPVVLIHAASLSATQWYLQAEDLGAGRHLYAIDIMGDIGLSEQAAPMRTRRDAADWLTATLDGLELDSPTLIGSSFGGFLATNLAVLRPGRVGSLVLLAPAATIQPFKRLANVVIRIGSLLPLPMTVKPGLRGMMGGELPDHRIVEQMEAGVRGFRYDRHGIYPSAMSGAELGIVECPVLLLLGDREMIYDPSVAAERARRTFRDVQVEVVRGVGHLLGMQQPGYVNARITRFLGRAPGRDEASARAHPNGTGRAPRELAGVGA